MVVLEVYAKYRIQCMRVNTSKIKFTAKATSVGSLMVQSTLVTMFKDCVKAKADLSMPMETLMKVAGWKTSCMAKENMFGPRKAERQRASGT